MCCAVPHDVNSCRWNQRVTQRPVKDTLPHILITPHDTVVLYVRRSCNFLFTRDPKGQFGPGKRVSVEGEGWGVAGVEHRAALGD